MLPSSSPAKDAGLSTLKLGFKSRWEHYLNLFYLVLRMEITDVFGNALEILKRNPKAIVPYALFSLLVGGMALIYIFSGLSGLGINLVGYPATLTTNITNAAELLPFLKSVVFFAFFLSIISFFIKPVLTGLYISAADRGYVSKAPSLSAAFKVAKKRYLSLLATELLIILIFAATFAILAAIFLLPMILFGTHASTAIWLILGIILLVIFLVLLEMFLYQAYVVVILENLGAVQAIKKSIEIGKKNLLKIFIVFLISAIILSLYGVLISVLQIILEFVFGDVLLGSTISQIINFILSSGITVWFIFVSVGFYNAYVSKRKSTKSKRHRKRRR